MYKILFTLSLPNLKILYLAEYLDASSSLAWIIKISFMPGWLHPNGSTQYVVRFHKLRAVVAENPYKMPDEHTEFVYLISGQAL